MALSHSPSIVRDGLVFYYDMANTKKSWKGKPTTNLIQSLGDPSAEYARGEFGQYFNLVSTFETNGLVPYSLSFEAKGNIPGYMQVYMQNSTYTKYSFINQSVTLSTEWQKFKFENLTPSGPNANWLANTPTDNRAMLATYTTYGSGRNPTLRNIQLELGSISSPFVNGTRSNTQAVLDLTGQNTINVDSLTYDVGGNFKFNGVNDFLTISNENSILTFGTNPFAISFWCKRDGAQVLNATIIAVNAPNSAINWQVEYTTTGSIRADIGSSGFSISGLPAPDGVWTHITITRENTGTDGVKGYVNGVLIDTATIADDLSYTQGLKMGLNRGGNAYSKGEVDLMMIYKNKSLSQQEVINNFNAQRDRYGI